MGDTTTMRIRRSTRDRVAALGARTHQNADSIVSQALDLYERQAFWDEWERIHAARPADEQAHEDAEQAPWERTSDEDRARGAAPGAHT